jgi:hypothetical protein
VSYRFTGDGIEHVDNVEAKHGMGRGCICSEWARDVGFKHYLGEVNDSFNTAMDVNAKLSTGEEV